MTVRQQGLAPTVKSWGDFLAQRRQQIEAAARVLGLNLDTAARGAANVLTLGGADRLAAGADSFLDAHNLSELGARYKANVVRQQNRTRDDARNRAAARTVGQIGGAALGIGVLGPMEGALAAAPRMSGAVAMTGRDAAALLTAGGVTGSGMQTLGDIATARRSSLGDHLGGAVGGVAGATAMPLGPARAGATGALVTSAAQDFFNGRPINIERAGQSAIVGNLLGGVAGVGGRVGSNLLSAQSKGRLGEALGDIRSTINGLRREWTGKYADSPLEGSKRYWFPDGRNGPVRFEDKFGIDPTLSNGQIWAQGILGDKFWLNHFLPADVGKVVAAPASAIAPQILERDRR